MPQLTVVTRDGARHEIEAQNGHTVMEVIRDNGIDELLAICGGCCSCATCHVYIAEDWLDRLPSQEPDERELIEFMGTFRETSRLSCQIPLTEELTGLEVELAPEE